MTYDGKETVIVIDGQQFVACSAECLESVD